MVPSITHRLISALKDPATFRVVAVAALFAAIAQITLGGVVRVTGSGDACPDWPLCHGQLIPPFEFEIMLEYSHRLSGLFVGVLVIATTGLAWYAYRTVRWIVVPSVASLVLVIVAGILGGVTVLTELDWWWRLVHLGVAEALVGCLVVAVIAGWSPAFFPDADERVPQENRKLGRTVSASALGIFVLILSGSYIVGEGYGSSCGTWPLCRGGIFPSGEPYLIHMSHRFVAALVGLHALAVLRSVWVWKHRRPSIEWSAIAVAVVFAVQTLGGAVTVWSGFDDGWKAMHLSLATLTWTAVAFLVALVYTPERFAVRGPRTAPGEVSKSGSTVA